MKNKKYGITSLRRQFPNDAVCMDFIFHSVHTDACSCGGVYKPLFSGVDADGKIIGRRQYQCSKCRNQIAPMKGTLLEKTDLPLGLWFHAIMLFANARSSISAKQLERDLEINYRTALRMSRLIRKYLSQGDDPLSGDVEFDSGIVGGKAKQKERMINKSVIFAAVQRGGEMRAQVMPDESAKSHKNFLWQNVSTKQTRLMTDSTNKLEKVAVGYDRHMVDHHRGEYVRGDIHVNNIETFWAHVKRSIKGTHKVVSRQYLQEYINGFVWHYNQRIYTDADRFAHLLNAVLQPAQ